MTTLAERLGYPADAKLLIVSCDDLGLTHAGNVATYDALRHGLATSASLMVPCPWARDAAGGYRGEDVGVHLTLNAELETYRWGPITHSPSLLDGDGGFPRTIEDAWDHADLDEVRRECRAQIERAIVWGFDVSHLTSHLGALQPRPEFFDAYLELAVDFGLPLRLGRRGRRARRRASRSAASRPTRASCSPTTWSRARRAPAGASSARCSSSSPGSPSWRCIPASTPTSCAPRAATTGRGASRTTRCSHATRRSATSWRARAPRSSAGARCATCSAR